MSDIAIKVEHISKVYKLYNSPMDRLKESLGLTKKKKYTEYYALNDVNIEVERGETVGIIGTNGAGKSTILKIITGVLNPSSGNVEINGRISALLELGAGFNMEYTGLENVYLNGTMIGFTREEIDAKLDNILEFADIGDFINQPVKTYSSGMFVRLAFAVAINIDPEILIVDEALSVGDVFFQAKCYHKFEEFKKMGKTILFVSHDLGSISKYCDRAILLNHGEKVDEGTPKDIIDIYKKILTNQYNKNDDEQNAESSFADDNLSIQMKESLLLNPNVNEYGSMVAEIKDFGIVDNNGNITNAVEKGAEYSIIMKVCFNADVTDPIFAVAIKDLRGVTITGTNTMYERINTGLVKKGEVRRITFKQVMSLQGGEYLLSLGCTGYETGELVVHHRLYDVCNITVISDKNTDGMYDMYAKVTIKQGD